MVHPHHFPPDRRRHRRAPHQHGGERHGFDPRIAFGGPGRHRGGIVRRGEVRPLILGALASKPMHGYEVIQALEAQSGGRWRPSAGSIYPSLQLLVDEGLATAEDVDGRRVYALTDVGRAAAEAAPPSPWADPRSRDGGDVRQLARQVMEAAMQVQRVGSPDAAVGAQVILLDTRAKLYGLLAADGAQAPDAEDPDADEPDTAADPAATA